MIIELYKTVETRSPWHPYNVLHHINGESCVHNEPLYESTSMIPLLEKYGIVEYDNKRLMNILTKVSNRIRNSANNAIKYDTTISGIPSVMFKEIKCEVDLSWCRYINVYFTDKMEEDAFLISDNKYKIIKRSGTSFDPVRKTGNVYEWISVGLSINKYTNFGELPYVILHEINHAYELLVNDITTDEMNADILYFINNGIDEFYNNLTMYSDDQMERCLVDLSSEDVYKIISEYGYLMNKSEIRSRLSQVYYDSLKSKVESNDYTLYKNLIRLFCHLLKDGTISNRSKMDFMNKYSGDFSRIYKEKFGKTISGFDKLIRMFIGRCEKFIKNADKIICDNRKI